jgi:hypothetical protein
VAAQIIELIDWFSLIYGQRETSPGTSAQVIYVLDLN